MDEWVVAYILAESRHALTLLKNQYVIISNSNLYIKVMMRKVLTIFIFTLLVSPLYAQVQPKSNLTTCDSIDQWLLEKLNLPSISHTPFEFELRFWDGKKMIRIWEDQGSRKAFVYFFLEEYSDDPNTGGRIHHSNMELKPLETQTLFNLVEDFQLVELPSEESITGWKQGLDGIAYVIDIKNNNSCQRKTYWTPTCQEDIKEARILQYFIHEILLCFTAVFVVTMCRS